MNIAFLGLGNMGFPIAQNLLADGHRVVTAIHHSPDSARRLQSLGGVVAATAAEAVADAALIFTIVPNDEALLGLLLAEDVRARIPVGSVIVDMTSASADAIRQVAAAYAPRNVSVVDAPVSGGVTGAERRTMSMLCAGAPAAFARIRPVVEPLAEKLRYVGAEPGLGKMLKSLNNLLSAVNKTAVGEAWRMAQAHGIDPDAFFDAISVSRGDSAALRAAFPRIRDDRYAPGFTVALMRKDLELALALAEGMTVPLAETTLDYYRQASPLDLEDSAAVAKVHFRRSAVISKDR